MLFNFLVTTDKNRLPEGAIVMVDGTVPGWTPRNDDLHFDHHRPGGALIQLEEIPEEQQLPEDFTFVTTQVDADACAAAAWLLLLNDRPIAPTTDYEEWAWFYQAKRALTAIAYDCDHLGLPEGDTWDTYREFAAKAVAALKESGNELIERMELPKSRKDWTEDDKQKYASAAFRIGTLHLVEAAKGERSYPGQNGEADAYFARMQEQRPKVYENCQVYRGCAIFDQRPFQGEYVDPRLLVEFARDHGVGRAITLTVRDGSRLPNAKLLQGLPDGFEPSPDPAFPLYSYTLGSVPLHPNGSPQYSDRGAWEKLQGLELAVRGRMSQAIPETSWGGRNEVGGSGWRDPAISTPEQVIDAVLESTTHR